jgi:hypothetical protein
MSFLRKQESRYFLWGLDSRFHGNDTQICYVGPSIEPILPRLPVSSSRLMGHVQLSKGGRGGIINPRSRTKFGMTINGGCALTCHSKLVSESLKSGNIQKKRGSPKSWVTPF